MVSGGMDAPGGDKQDKPILERSDGRKTQLYIYILDPGKPNSGTISKSTTQAYINDVRIQPCAWK